VYYQTSAPGGDLLIGDLWYDTDDNNTPYVWNGTWVKVLEGYINGLADAKITTFEQTKVGYATVNSPGFTYNDVTYATGEVFDNGGAIYNKSHVDTWNSANPSRLLTWRQGLPLATAIKQVGVRTVDGQSTTIEEQATAIYGPDGLRSQWSVKIDNNGWVSGFGLSSTPSTDGNPYSEFGVRADRFYVAAPNTPKTQPQNLSYFALQSGTTTNGIAIVFRKATFSAYGVTTRWIYFKATSPGQLKDDQWAVIKGVASSDSWNTNWLVDHIGPKIVYNDAGQLLRNETTLANVDANTIFIQIESATEYDSLPTTGVTPILNNVVQATATYANIPFIVLTGASDRLINGAVYKPGVYATNAYIKKAQITEAAIADAAITNAKIGNVIQSANYAANSSGWKIDKAGDAEFNTVIVRKPSKNIAAGLLANAAAVTFPGFTTIANSQMQVTSEAQYIAVGEPGSVVTLTLTFSAQIPAALRYWQLELGVGSGGGWAPSTVFYDDAISGSAGDISCRIISGTTGSKLVVPADRVFRARFKYRVRSGNDQDIINLRATVLEVYA
jgi:hypothetical protein